MSATGYSIVVRGEVPVDVLERLGAREARPSRGGIELICDVVDQSQLIGLLSGLSRAGIEIVSAAPLRPGRL